MRLKKGVLKKGTVIASCNPALAISSNKEWIRENAIKEVNSYLEKKAENSIFLNSNFATLA
jgi:hypothetical protein